MNTVSEFQPLHDRLLVRVLDEISEQGSILIPETARRPGAVGGDKFLRQGIVVTAGPGDVDPRHPERRLPMHVQVGDRILYDHPSNREETIDGQLHVILHEEQHVLAVLG